MREHAKTHRGSCARARVPALIDSARLDAELQARVDGGAVGDVSDGAGEELEQLADRRLEPVHVLVDRLVVVGIGETHFDAELGGLLHDGLDGAHLRPGEGESAQEGLLAGDVSLLGSAGQLAADAALMDARSPSGCRRGRIVFVSL